MKIDKPINSNYAAVVVAIKNIIPLDGCDNVVGTTIFGFQAIVGKDTKVGDIGVMFPAECQLSDELCYYNNLYRHGDKNIDESKKGYIEDNRRVKAVKFRGHPSSCLFMSLDCLNYTRANISELVEGDEFDTLNGKEVCRKYVVKEREPRENKISDRNKFKRVDSKHFPEHFDSDNYFKWSPTVDPEKEVIVTQKIHGTSIRIGNSIVKRKLTLADRIAKMFGANIKDTEYDYIYGSRKVVKDINNPNQNHFYDVDLWTIEGKKLDGILPQNYILFAELIGYTPSGAIIQKGYDYGIEQGKAELYVYRITIVNDQGIMTDLSWDNIKEFCNNNGLNHVAELWRGKLRDFKVEDFMDKRYFDEGYRNCIGLGNNKDIVDEGVCIRVDGLRPYIMKAKAPKFLEHETKLLDTGEEDLESSQS